MEQRIDYSKTNSTAYKTMIGIEMYLAKCSIEESLLHLIKYRVSQINGCAYCLDMHSKDLLAGGENVQRLLVLDAWRETPFYTDRERAALAWAEAVTKITEGHASDEIYDETGKHFSAEEMVDLTLAITTINAWNRIAISFRTKVGTYQPGQFSAAE